MNNTAHSPRNRAFTVVSNYLTREIIEDFLISHPKITGIGAIHDRDAAQAHGHVFLFDAKTPRTPDAVKRMFPVPVQVKPFFVTEEGRLTIGKFALARGARYLLHENEKAGVKAPYSEDEIIASPGYDWRADVAALKAYEVRHQKAKPLYEDVIAQVLAGKLTAREVALKYPMVYAVKRDLICKLADDARHWRASDREAERRQEEQARQQEEAARREAEAAERRAQREREKAEEQARKEAEQQARQAEIARENARREAEANSPEAIARREAAAAEEAAQQAKDYERYLYRAIGWHLAWDSPASSWRARIDAERQRASAFYRHVSLIDDPSDPSLNDDLPLFVSESDFDAEDLAALDGDPFASIESTLVCVAGGFGVGTSLSPVDDDAVTAAAREEVTAFREYLDALLKEIYFHEFHAVMDAKDELLTEAAAMRVEAEDVYSLEVPSPYSRLTKTQLRKLNAALQEVRSRA